MRRRIAAEAQSTKTEPRQRRESYKTVQNPQAYRIRQNPEEYRSAHLKNTSGAPLRVGTAATSCEVLKGASAKHASISGAISRA